MRAAEEDEPEAGEEGDPGGGGGRREFADGGGRGVFSAAMFAGAPLWPCRPQDPPPDLVVHDAPPDCGRSIPDDEPKLDWFDRVQNPPNPDPDGIDQRAKWLAPEIKLDEGVRVLFDEAVLEPS